MDRDLGASRNDDRADDTSRDEALGDVTGDGYQAFQAFHEGARLLAASNSHAAVVALERARELEPDAPSVRETLARAYFRAGNLPAATEEFRRSVELDPVNDYAYFGLGLCLLRGGDQVGARRNLKLAVAMRPDSADYRRALDRALRALSRLVCCDLDGVLWLGPNPIAGAADAVNALRAAGIRVGYLTNNSSRTPGSVVEQLDAMGVDASEDDVVTSAQAAAALLRADLPPGARVLACAGPGVVEALGAEGYEVVDHGPADAVVVGFHPTFDFEGLHRASAAIRAGARFVATNVDATYPGPDGLLPGNGAIVAAVATASGHAPTVAGKPEAPTVALVRERFAAELRDGPGLMVGDRPSTDGALADALGWRFALVLTGISDGAGGGEPVPVEPAPAYVAPDLAALAARLLAEGWGSSDAVEARR